MERVFAVFTTEITMILPIVLIMILCIIMMAFIIAELNWTILSTERAFIMQTCEEMVLNGRSAIKSDDLKVSNRGVWTLYTIGYRRQIGNPFHEIMKKNHFEFNLSYELMRVNRPVLKLILLGGESVFEIH